MSSLSNADSSNASGGMKQSNRMMILLLCFGFGVVATNLFFLPSLGWLVGSSPAIPSHKHLALEEFKEGRTTKEKKEPTKEREPTTDDTKNEPSKDSNEKKETKLAAEAAEKFHADKQPKESPEQPPPPHNPESTEMAATQHPRIAGLNCDRFGGPSREIAAEMVYWRDIPSDATFVSPFKDPTKKQYLTFEPDEGGFNNIRMSMETATALAHAMGRILVLPPEQNMYLLGQDHRRENNRFTFHKFFPFEAIAEEHDAVDVISMEEFLETEVMAGNLLDANGKPSFPPNNHTKFGGSLHEGRAFWNWLRTVATASKADFSKCVLAFPAKPGKEAVENLQKLYQGMDMQKQSHGLWHSYQGRPRPVDAAPHERLHEQLSFRKEICLYNQVQQNSKVMHFMGDNNSGARLLTHFYAFLFFEDWQQDLWTKRYVRDHLRYIDAIQCGAARIVHAVRQKAKDHGNPDGWYDSMHVRRGDFQYKHTRISAEKIYQNIREIFTENATVFVATDEREKTFFDPLREHYNLLFLDEFLHLLPPEFNKNYYGMLDQRVASRGRIFFGAHLSTFTGYINRMRGYHTQKEQSQGYLEGNLRSYFYVPRENRDEMATYSSLKGPLWGREFPTAWRDIDHNVHESHIVGR